MSDQFRKLDWRILNRSPRASGSAALLQGGRDASGGQKIIKFRVDFPQEMNGQSDFKN